mgnify:CR=1 FL=1
MTDDEATAQARAVYRFLGEQARRNGLDSAPWEHLAERFGIWGEDWARVLAASGGHLAWRRYGLIGVHRRNVEISRA